MLTADLQKKFWNDFSIDTQEVTLDFPFANPSDAARSLIKARNWTGNLTEILLEVTDSIEVTKRVQKEKEFELMKLERSILAANQPVPTSASKNRELLKSFIVNNAQEEDFKKLSYLEECIFSVSIKLSELEKDKNKAKAMLDALTKSTEWVIQYLNWMKYEAKSEIGNS